MARAHPNQLNLFDLPAVLFATSEPAGPVRPEPLPDRLSLCLTVTGRATAALLGLCDALRAEPGGVTLAPAECFCLPLVELGEADDYLEADLRRVVAVADAVRLSRFSLTFSMLEPGDAEEAPCPAWLCTAECGPAGPLGEHLLDGLRDRGLGALVEPGWGDRLLLGHTVEPLAPLRLERPLELALRELALVRSSGDGRRAELLHRAALAG